jgi:serine phosphatase RsbU (regulator of sigma subunit)
MLWQQPEKVFPGLTVATFYEPAAGDALVGGDFVDAFRLPDDSIMLIVGDVTGKGLQAAARTVEVRFASRAFAQDHPDPARAMGRLNEFICDFHPDDEQPDGNALVALSLVVVDASTGAARAASAGAEPPLILRAGGSVNEVEVRGLMLGIDRGVVYKTSKCTLDPGDTLLMTTDGITEARHGREFFGQARVGEAGLLAAQSGTPHDIGKAILDAARTHTGGRFRDDICLLVARRQRA